MSDEPICVASRMRWLSPPDSVAAERASVRYCRPTLCRKCSRERTSRRMLSAIWASFSLSVSLSRNASSSVIGSAVNSEMFSPPTVTASTSGRSRAPWQSGQAVSAMHDSIDVRMASLCVS